METTATKIKELKRKKNAVILAHYYTTGDVQEVADFVGDSLALSKAAAGTDADIILFAGVNFMAETAKVLSPDKKVLLPDPEAGCSLAESCREEDFKTFLKRYPDHTVVSYVNTSVGVKALTDICCTSSNALQIVRALPEDTKIVFAPDRNLGGYIKSVTGRENMVLWDGACHVHERFSLERILELKKSNPGAKIVVHPECKAAVAAVADFVGSTAAIIGFCGRDESDTYIVVTESGIMHELVKRYPDKRFIAAPSSDPVCACNDCAYMKLVTLDKIYDCLLNETNEVVIDEAVRARAERAIRNMLKYK